METIEINESETVEQWCCNWNTIYDDQLKEKNDLINKIKKSLKEDNLTPMEIQQKKQTINIINDGIYQDMRDKQKLYSNGILAVFGLIFIVALNIYGVYLWLYSNN